MLRPAVEKDHTVKHVNRASRTHRLASRASGRAFEPSGRIRAVRPSRPEYDRRTALARVLALWPSEIEDESLQGRVRIVAKLRRALRAERQRGLAGHWTYDLARHAELLRVYKQELQALVSGTPADDGQRK
jgi:hypothetical protein